MEIDILGNNDTRSGFGAGLSYLGKTNPNVVALCADLTGSLKMNDFQNKFPDRFFQVGIASQHDGNCSRFDYWWENTIYWNIC